MMAHAKARRWSAQTAFWLFCPAALGLTLAAQGAATAPRLACTISSEKESGTVLTFDSSTKALTWGNGQSQIMTLDIDTADPFELKAVSRRQDSPKISFHAWAEKDRLRFTADNDGMDFVGACERK